MELDDIKAIIDLMRKKDLAVFKLERDGFKMELEAQQSPAAGAAAPIPVPSSVPVQAGPVPTNTTENCISISEGVTTLKEIVSPMVGTFYRAASPDSAPYVESGQGIKEDTVICMIKAMKAMNEIKAEATGTVVEILVENGTPVQYGQPLIRVR